MTGPALSELDGSDFDHGCDLVADQPPDASPSQLRLIPLVLLDALTVEARKSLATSVDLGNGDAWHTDHPGMSRLLHLTDL